MDAIPLPPELERLASRAVAAGRYQDVSELMGVWAMVLRRFEEQRTAFIASLEEAHAEADRDGWLSLDEVMADMDRVIADTAARAA